MKEGNDEATAGYNILNFLIEFSMKYSDETLMLVRP